MVSVLLARTFQIKGWCWKTHIFPDAFNPDSSDSYVSSEQVCHYVGESSCPCVTIQVIYKKIFSLSLRTSQYHSALTIWTIGDEFTEQKPTNVKNHKLVLSCIAELSQNFHDIVHDINNIMMLLVSRHSTLNLSPSSSLYCIFWKSYCCDQNTSTSSAQLYNLSLLIFILCYHSCSPKPCIQVFL